MSPLGQTRSFGGDRLNVRFARNRTWLVYLSVTPSLPLKLKEPASSTAGPASSSWGLRLPIMTDPQQAFFLHQSDLHRQSGPGIRNADRARVAEQGLDWLACAERNLSNNVAHLSLLLIGHSSTSCSKAESLLVACDIA